MAEDVGGAGLLLLLGGTGVVAGTVEVEVSKKQEEVAAELPSFDKQSLRAAVVGATTTGGQSVALVVG